MLREKARGRSGRSPNRFLHSSFSVTRRQRAAEVWADDGFVDEANWRLVAEVEKNDKKLVKSGAEDYRRLVVEVERKTSTSSVILS